MPRTAALGWRSSSWLILGTCAGRLVDNLPQQNTLFPAGNHPAIRRIGSAGLSAFGAFEQDSGCLNIIDIDTCRDTGAIQRQILRGVNITADDPSKLTRPLTYMEAFTKRALSL